jgi:hypothetical protein
MDMREQERERKLDACREHYIGKDKGKGKVVPVLN